MYTERGRKRVEVEKEQQGEDRDWSEGPIHLQNHCVKKENWQNLVF